MDASELAYTGIARQADLVRAGEISSRELVQLYLDRIPRHDPRLNAFRVVWPESALAEADAAQGRRAAGEEAPLLGVPVAIKDGVDVAGEVTTHGTGGFDRPAAEDAEIVKRLRAAGAVLIGKTNLPELAICGFTESKTWGVTRNPWDPGRTTGGSSGGSGAAVAAGLVGGASASDGAGSIRIPAANCGLFGLKPQRGRISLAPLREHWHGMTVIGCLTRHVVDTALYLDVTAGSRGGRRGVPAGARSTVHRSGSQRSGPAQDRRLDDSSEARRPADRGRGGARSGRGDRGFGRLGSLISSRALRRAKAAIPRHAARINRLFDDHDALLIPTVGRPPVEVGRWEGMGALRTLLGMSRVYPFTGAWNYTGQPAASVPAGFDAEGLPLSVQLVGRPNDEATLLSLAAQLEAERPWAHRRPPE